MNAIARTAELGQAIWLDFVRRSFLQAGELGALVDVGLRGVTSNPSIFQLAITSGDEYDEDIRRLAGDGASTDAIYEALVIADIRQAADILAPVYEATDGRDGFVSLEVNPHLANDAEGTIAEAVRFSAAVNRPNLLIKVPATPEGMVAIEALISRGISVNVTLIFSLDHYEASVQAYMRGVEARLAAGQPVDRVASVASFFLSRVDSAVDAQLEAEGNTDLSGKIAIANAKIAYERFEQLVAGERWQMLAAQGAQVQRPLWASTSTKNPAYPDTMYVDELIGPDTVNTLPPATLAAFQDHGRVAETVNKGVDEARVALEQLATLGVDLDAITEELQAVGVQKFIDAFDRLLAALEKKRAELAG